MSLSRAQGTAAPGASEVSHRQSKRPQSGSQGGDLAHPSKCCSGAQVLIKNANYWGPSQTNCGSEFVAKA